MVGPLPEVTVRFLKLEVGCYLLVGTEFRLLVDLNIEPIKVIKLM